MEEDFLLFAVAKAFPARSLFPSPVSQLIELTWCISLPAKQLSWEQAWHAVCFRTPAGQCCGAVTTSNFYYSSGDEMGLLGLLARVVFPGCVYRGLREMSWPLAGSLLGEKVNLLDHSPVLLLLTLAKSSVFPPKNSDKPTTKPSLTPRIIYFFFPPPNASNLKRNHNTGDHLVLRNVQAPRALRPRAGTPPGGQHSLMLICSFLASDPECHRPKSCVCSWKLTMVLCKADTIMCE